MPEPVLPPSFEWRVHPVGRVLVCCPLDAVARHAFTTRELALPAVDDDPVDDRAALAAVLGIARDRLALLKQVHGACVVHLPAGPGAAPVGDGTEGDGLTTRDPHVGVAVKVADCVPVLLADPVSGAVAAVHAGWRGTAAAIVQAAVATMGEMYQCRPADLVAAIGPSIGPCCYEVGTDVFDTFLEAGARPDELAEWFSVVPVEPASGDDARESPAARGRRPGKFWLDTWRANSDQLATAGVPRERISVSRLCTRCHPTLFHSYRADGARAGRMLAGIRGNGRH